MEGEQMSLTKHFLAEREGDDEGSLPLRKKQIPDARQEVPNGQEGGIASHRTGRIGRNRILDIKRRIAYNSIETERRNETADVSLHDFHSLAERASLHILSSLARRGGIYLYPINPSPRRALSRHQGNQSTTRPHIENPTLGRQRGPSTQQDAIRAYSHGTAVMMNGELLEAEIG